MNYICLAVVLKLYDCADKMINSHSLKFIFLYKFFKLYRFFFLFPILPNNFKKFSLNFNFKTINLKSFNSVFFKNIYSIVYNNNYIYKIFSKQSINYSSMLPYFSTSNIKYNFISLNNYLFHLLMNSINFLIIDPSTSTYNKIIYYNLLYSYKDLINHKWFFNLEINFLKQKKWKSFFLFLFKKYKIAYLVVLDEFYFLKKLKFSINLNFIKILIVNIYAKHFIDGCKLFNYNSSLINIIFIRYIFYISSMTLFFKKQKNFTSFWEKRLKRIAL